MPRLTLEFLNSTLAKFSLLVIKHNDNRLMKYSLVTDNCREIPIARATTLAKMRELISSHKSSYCFKDEDGDWLHDLHHLGVNFKKYLNSNYYIQLEQYGRISVYFVPSADLREWESVESFASYEDAINYIESQIEREAVETENSTDLLLALSNDHIKRYEAACCTKNESILRLLSTDSNSWVRIAVLTNPKTPIDVLETFMTDPDVFVRERLAMNTMSSKVLIQLSTDDDYRVRAAAVRNRHYPTEFMYSCTHDPEYLVRYALALNPNAPISILEKLSKDSHKSVKRESLYSLSERTASAA